MCVTSLNSENLHEMMDKCMENNSQMFIKDKSHVTKVYVTSFRYLGFHYKDHGYFSMNKQNISINVKWCPTQSLSLSRIKTIL